MEYPRTDRKKRYPLGELIIITIPAFLSGAEGWEDKPEFLALIALKGAVIAIDAMGCR
ncbi:MAG: hypothetical protein LBG27_06245 [Spirochaetaceae bacterium]|nr:hypothetical protein [Spirochaetaceae bacterium]